MPVQSPLQAQNQQPQHQRHGQRLRLGIKPHGNDRQMSKQKTQLEEAPKEFLTQHRHRYEPHYLEKAMRPTGREPLKKKRTTLMQPDLQSHRYRWELQMTLWRVTSTPTMQ